MAQVILMVPVTEEMDSPRFVVSGWAEPLLVGVYASDGAPQDVGARLFKVVDGVPQDTRATVGVFPHLFLCEPGEYFVRKPYSERPHGVFFEA